MNEKIERFRQLSSQIDELYVSGKDAEGEKLLNDALKQASDNEAYRLFFEGELAEYKGKDKKRQEALFREAAGINPNDHFILRSLGVSLFYQDKYEEAIEWYKKALAINEKDYDALRNIGVSLSKQGKFEESLEWYKKALAINDKDYDAVRQIGVSLSKQGKPEEALECYKKALAINDNDYRAYREWSVSEYKRGNIEEAFEKIKKAYELSPKDKDVQAVLQIVCRRAGRDVNEVIKKISKGVEPPRIEKGVPDLKALVGMVQEPFREKIDLFSEEKKNAEKRLDDFLRPASDLRDDISFFLLLRKWNSYTPIIPSGDDERSVGGGYYIRHGGNGTVIDPGYNFIENFYKAGCRIVDVDNVIITHAHNDHTNDFESIMTLLHQYNSHNKYKPDDPKYKKIKVYMNTGSLLKFAGLLDLRGCPFIDYLYTMTPEIQFKLGDGMKLTVLPAYHDELVAKKYAVGLHFSIPTKEGERRILFTSDTGLFPQIKRGDQDKADISKPEIHEKYGDFKKDINLLVPHLGSIKEQEIKMSIDSEDVFYPNHLGILGAARMITVIKPRLAVISEFGEELKVFRKELIDLLSGVVKGYYDDDSAAAPVVLPGDLPFIYNIGAESVHCVLSEGMTPFAKMKYELHDSSNNFYYYSEEKARHLGKLEGYCKSFEDKRNGKICPSYMKEGE